MPALHKISINFYDAEYSLIAIHTSLEAYRLVYWLNIHLKTKFKRQKNNLDLNTAAQFSVFDWQDTRTDSYWALLSNKQLSSVALESQDLFSETLLEKKQYLIPEHKGVDFFLKIEDEGYLNIAQLVAQLKQIAVIATAFEIDCNQIKSKNNLIF
ncbi:MAG: hypothetical protein ACI9KR_000111 [Arcticibacterium sp.]|jgi:hypothetical protein